MHALHDLLARPAVAALLDALCADGEEARIVGGAVRDALMGRPVGDIDIATTTLPDETIRRAQARGWKAVPTGLAHGTITAVINRVPYEVTTLRRDVATDGRHATVVFSRDFAEDAARRDFTLNALSLGRDGTVHDYATGVADAAMGSIRFMGDPARRISEDYLRILRFFRLRASHGQGAPDAAALAACAALKPGLAQLSRERVRAELMKLLAAPGAVQGAREMKGIHLWPVMMPGFAISLPALERVCALEGGAAADPVLRLAALCQLCGTPERAQVLQDLLALSNAEHDHLAAVAAKAPLFNTGAASLRQLVYMTGAHGFRPALFLAHAARGAAADDTQRLLDEAAPLLAAPPRNPFTSGMVAASGVPPGPRMGHVLRTAERLWLAQDLPEDAASIAQVIENAVRESTH